MTKIRLHSSVYNKTLGRWGTVVQLGSNHPLDELGGPDYARVEYDGWHTSTGHISHLVHEHDYDAYVDAGSTATVSTGQRVTGRPTTVRLLVKPVCEWFALCDNVATTTVPHPVLGEVPICNRCQAKNERLQA